MIKSYYLLYVLFLMKRKESRNPPNTLLFYTTFKRIKPIKKKEKKRSGWLQILLKNSGSIHVKHHFPVDPT